MIKDSLRAKHVFSYHSTPELDVNKLVGIWPGNLDFELSIARFIFKQRSFDAYLACSDNYLDTVKKNLDPKVKNAYRIYYGVDMQKFSFKLRVEREKYGFGNDDFNLRLSTQRAQAVAKALDHPNVIARGVGETILLYSNDTPEGRFYCRTVDIISETPMHW